MCKDIIVDPLIAQSHINVPIYKAHIYSLKNGIYETAVVTLGLPRASSITSEQNLSVTFSGKKGELLKYCKEILKIDPVVNEF